MTLEVIIPTKAAAQICGLAVKTTNAQLRALLEAGLKPINEPSNGHRFFARWRLNEVQTAAVELAARREAEAKAAAERAEARRRKESVVASASNELTDFIHVLNNVYTELQQVREKVDAVYKLWTE